MTVSIFNQQVTFYLLRNLMLLPPILGLFSKLRTTLFTNVSEENEE